MACNAAWLPCCGHTAEENSLMTNNMCLEPDNTEKANLNWTVAAEATTLTADNHGFQHRIDLLTPLLSAVNSRLRL